MPLVGRRSAAWLFPLYLLAINLFVLPIAVAGLLTFGSGSGADMFVLTLPPRSSREPLALFAFICWLSAATGMVIVETIPLSTMVCNDLIVPSLLRLKVLRRESLARTLIQIRRGALAGLTGGFGIWAYTLLIPSFAQSGWQPLSLVEPGPLGLAAPGPQHLFGLTGLDPITHAVLWSLLCNIGLLVGVSLFVDVCRQRTGVPGEEHLWHGTTRVRNLRELVARMLGPQRAEQALGASAATHGAQLHDDLVAGQRLVAHMERELARNREMQATREVTDGVLTVVGDRDRLQQVVINLLSNALKYCEPGAGRILLRLSRQGEEARLEVADNGPGVRPEERERIFEKFHQIRSAAKGKPQGAGLGLAICRAIIEGHGGRIWVEGRPGDGARFVFTLPARGKRPEPPPETR